MAAMTVSQQVRAIKNATQNAAKSKESALRFLQQAGIIKGGTAVSNTSSSASDHISKK